MRWLRIARAAGGRVLGFGVGRSPIISSAAPCSELPVDLGKLVVSGTKITMEQPRLSGFTNDARAYEFTADAAAQDITKPDSSN